MTATSLSLLERLTQQQDSDSWQRLVDLYTPLLAEWIRRYEALQTSDVDDLVQDVLLVLARELPQFEHSRQPGAFRSWLRTILVNRLRHFWRSRQHRPAAVGGSDFQWQLDELEDAASILSRQWDREHDRYVMHGLLSKVKSRFASKTWQAFRRQVIESARAVDVAEELGMPLHSVYAAKSRVLNSLRQEADGLVE